MSRIRRRVPIGAELQEDGATHFRVWAPDPRDVMVVVEPGKGNTREMRLATELGGYRSTLVSDVTAGDRYWYRIDGDLVPDPASRFQPDGPFGPSEIVDPAAFRWTDDGWRGVSMPAQVVYECHVGTFTSEGTWRAAMERLPDLVDIGITLLEVMPVSEFPGRFGWGYDGVFPYAPTRLYGAPDDLRALIDRAHALGLGIILDVVYNHFGPDGAVFRRFAKGYFAEHYENEWGEALNFDGEQSCAVREYFASNAAYWIDEYHFDGLRLDATQTIYDASADHIISHVGQRARDAAGHRSIVLIGENERQHVRLIQPREEGGYGLDALWNDDFHHSAVVAVTGRREAYYSDHSGAPQEFVSSAKYGYLFQGQRYAWQKNRRGTSARGVPPAAFVNYIENHDQVANSGDGARLRFRTTPGRYRAMTALLLLLPGTPMLFQGEEFGTSVPFLYFADHKPELAASVQKGRAEFVRQFPSLASADMQAHLPAPHDPRTFASCKLDWSERVTNLKYVQLHKDLLTLRRTDVAFRQQMSGAVDGAVLGPEQFVLRFTTGASADDRLLVVNLGPDFVAGSIAEPLVAPPDGHEWEVRWSSERTCYGGLGTPEIVGSNGWRVPGHSAVVLRPVEINDRSSRT